MIIVVIFIANSSIQNTTNNHHIYERTQLTKQTIHNKKVARRWQEGSKQVAGSQQEGGKVARSSVCTWQEERNVGIG